MNSYHSTITIKRKSGDIRTYAVIDPDYHPFRKGTKLKVLVDGELEDVEVYSVSPPPTKALIILEVL